MPNQKNVPSRSTSTQQHQTKPLGAPVIVIDANGRTVSLQPLADALSPATIATLAAIRKNGGRQ